MDKVIVALDNFSREELTSFLDKYHSKIKIVKIGLELFNKYGQEIVKEITEKYQLEIFLDLKLHDIPSTVHKSIKSLAELKIKFLTVHLSGGDKMIKDALWARDSFLPQTKILGVSILTSLDESDAQSVYDNSVDDSFTKLYKIAKETKIDGVILSGHELELTQALDKNYQHNTLKICPGIRFDGDESADQVRTMLPKEAFQNGANYLVIGRSITLKPEVLDNIHKII